MGPTPDEVLKLRAPTKSFLCPLSANTFAIDFLRFEIKDYETKRVIFEISKDSPQPPPENLPLAGLDQDSYRKIRYSFLSDMLRTECISTTLTFSVGSKPLEDFRMIERHYFKDQLIKSFDFNFGFVIPNSTNTWEAVYAVPLLADELVEQMVEEPYKTSSDSFYFVGDTLVMHNKAEYKYYHGVAESKNPGDGGAGAKGSKEMKYAAKMGPGARAERKAVSRK